MTDVEGAPRWQFRDHRELPSGGQVIYHWRMDVLECYCVDSGRAVRVPGDRCLSHGGRGVMCTTAERMPPKCRHTRLSPNHPYPHCSECGQDAEDVTDQVGGDDRG